MRRYFNIKLALVGLVMCCVPGNHVAAQQAKVSEPIMVNGSNNEITKANLDMLAQAAMSDRLIIAIARLGSGELSPKLSLHRLRTIRSYLETVRAMPKQRIITAEGKPVHDVGRVEVYMSDMLFMVFTLERTKDFAPEQ